MGHWLVYYGKDEGDVAKENMRVMSQQSAITP
jgi:hypothetical protein